MKIKDIIGKKIAVSLPTQELYDTMMANLEKEGIRWASGAKPTALNCFLEFGEDLCITLKYWRLNLIRTDIQYFKKENYKIIKCRIKEKTEQ